MANERPGPNSSYWLANGASTLPADVWGEYLNTLSAPSLMGMGGAHQIPEPPPAFPVTQPIDMPENDTDNWLGDERLAALRGNKAAMARLLARG